MKRHRWSLALGALGLLIPSVSANAEDLKPLQLQTLLSSTTLGGYVDTSMIWQASGGRTDVARSYDGGDRQNGFNMNVTQLNLDRPLSDGDWSAGYKISLIAGPDAQAAAGTGGSPFGIHNAFVKLHAPVGNGLNVKVGVFSSIVGYEYFESYKNANYSHSYGFYLEPGRQTGVVADYRVNDVLSFSVGAGNAYSPGRANVRPLEDRGGSLTQANGKLNLMGSFSLTAPSKNGAWAYGTFERGTTGVPGTLGIKATEYFLGIGLPTAISGLDLVLTYDHTDSDRTGDAREPGYPPHYATAASLYLNYKATDKLTLSNRFDWATGAAGAFGADATGKAPGSEDKYIADVLTISYPFWTNVTTRAELRWDHDRSEQAGGRFAFGSGPQGVRNGFSLGVNIVYVF